MSDQILNVLALSRALIREMIIYSTKQGDFIHECPLNYNYLLLAVELSIPCLALASPACTIGFVNEHLPVRVCWGDNLGVKMA